MAVTDGPVLTRFNISDLSTMEMLYPQPYPLHVGGSCAHFMREIGTENSINVAYRKGKLQSKSKFIILGTRQIFFKRIILTWALTKNRTILQVLRT